MRFALDQDHLAVVGPLGGAMMKEKLGNENTLGSGSRRSCRKGSGIDGGTTTVSTRLVIDDAIDATEVVLTRTRDETGELRKLLNSILYPAVEAGTR